MSWVRTFCSCFSSLVYPLYSTPRLDSLQTRSPYFSLSTPRGASSFFRRQKTRRKELAVPGRRISTTPATTIFTPSPAHSLEHCVQDTLFSRDTPGSACSFLLLAQAPISFAHPGSTFAFLFPVLHRLMSESSGRQLSFSFLTTVKRAEGAGS